MKRLAFSPFSMRGLVFALLMLASTVVMSTQVLDFDSPEQEESYRRLVAELRCTVCQNQNIADSNADLAKDLRDKVYAMLRAGKSENEIRDFMVDRYGNFVLYSPPKQGASLLIWILPFVVLVGGGLVLFRVARAHRASGVKQAAAEVDDCRLDRAAELLEREERDHT